MPASAVVIVPGKLNTISSRPDYFPARDACDKLPHPRYGHRPGGLVAHDPAAADSLATGFELRLDQRHEPGARRRQAKRRGKRLDEADEAEIGDDGADRPLDRSGIELPGVGLLQHADPGVTTKLRM
jgi:hypothetical protein